MAETNNLNTRHVVDILGFSMDLVSYEETVERVVSWIRGDRRPRILLTVNSSLLVMRESDRAFRRACDNVDLSVPDGVPVVWLSKLLGTPLKERIAGVDLMYSLLQRGNDEKLRVYFLGGTEQVITRLQAICRDRFPDLVIAGARNGYFDSGEEQEIFESIRESNSDLLFIGMPSPEKELIADIRKEEIGVPVIIGVGGSFDVITGKVRRAPRLMQTAGLEWLWRLLMEPRKLWRRYLYTNTRFLWLSSKAIWRRFVGNSQPGRSKKSRPIL